MMDRDSALTTLAIGDIFHAESANHPSMICLVTSVTDTSISARTITTQLSFEFDRRTGEANWTFQGREQAPARIHSTARLPDEIHDALVGLDRRYHGSRNVEDGKLTSAEKRALLFVAQIYPDDQL
jgi:hypothetical protein